MTVPFHLSKSKGSTDTPLDRKIKDAVVASKYFPKNQVKSSISKEGIAILRIYFKEYFKDRVEIK